MIPFLPDLPILSGAQQVAAAAAAQQPQPQPQPHAVAGPDTGAVPKSHGTLDFAGLVHAALPGAAMTIGAVIRGAVSTAFRADSAADPALPAAALQSPTPVATAPVPPPELLREWPQAPADRPPANDAPGGTILPRRGAALPQSPTPPPSPVTSSVPPAPFHAPPASHPTATARMRAVAAAEPEAAPASLVAQPEDTDAVTADQVEAVTTPDAGGAVAMGLTAPAAPAPTAPPVTLPPPAAARIAAAAARAPAQPARNGVAAEAGAVRARAAMPTRTEHTALPARAVLNDTAPDAAPDSPAALPSPSTQAALLAEPAPAVVVSPAAPPTAAPANERAEPRAPAPQQETTIAAVGELREALRAARPELTLRHAEFGLVSLRLEQTAGQDWRAVLASRDPGFVPAIQAALTERAVAAAADTASTGATGSGQNGASDQRYGSSPNGGQGSSQPYLAQSSNRDEGQSSHPQNRQPSTTDTVASRAGEAEAERPDRSERGVFA